MNTNINQSGLPDISVLQDLANEFFKALPNSFAHVPTANSPKTADSPNVHAVDIPPPPSISGFGASPTPTQYGDAADVSKGFNFNQNPQHPFGNEQILNQLAQQAIVPPQYNDVLGNKTGSSYLPDPHFTIGQVPQSVAGSGASPSAIQHERTFDVNNPQTSLPDPHFTDGKVPQSVAGSGASPTGVDLEKQYAFNPNQNGVPKTQFTEGQVPQSVAGSGASPEALQHEAYFDANNPQTSHRDPHFSNGKTAQSVGNNGNGSSPVLQAAPYTPTTPTQTPSSTNTEGGISSFKKELAQALAQIGSFTHVPQIPTATPSGFSDASFYFLKGNPLSHFHATPDFNPFSKTSANGLARPPFDVNLIKKDFPILNEKVNGRPIIWLDNAATTQKPKQVIDRISYFYEHENSNIHRAAHELAARATDAYEAARQKVQHFLNAGSINEIIFVRGATEGINLIAKSWGEQYLQAGDEIIVSHLEHHANIVPWQQLAAQKGLKIRVIPVDETGQILLDEYAKLFTPKTRLVAFTQVSNALGTVTPAKRMVEIAHQAGAKVLVDGAQSVSHMRVDVRDLDADWFVFSGHKVFGPTGIGVVYGKEALLNETQPWQGGGNMIKDVTFEHTQYHPAPTRFEAGTGNIADAVGLGAAIDYVTRLGMDAINFYEHNLLQYGTMRLKEVKGLHLVGTAHDKASVMSFVLDGYTNDEVGQALNQVGVAVRTGHHCAQPILRRFGLESTVRPSLAFYNTCSDIDVLVDTLHRLREGRPQSAKR